MARVKATTPAPDPSAPAHAGQTHGQRRGKAARSGPPSPEERLTSKRVSYRIHPDAIAALESLAARWKVSRSRALARVLLAALAAEEGK
jgi:hypothetical protein